ncbi:MAG: hypothetical protein HYS52_01910 [Candidatus Wildermuthbacteria bacterium]|nr:hypothetical protein [Candidatus Wildermuthbacteria bacterium]
MSSLTARGTVGLVASDIFPALLSVLVRDNKEGMLTVFVLRTGETLQIPRKEFRPLPIILNPDEVEVAEAMRKKDPTAIRDLLLVKLIEELATLRSRGRPYA